MSAVVPAVHGLTADQITALQRLCTRAPVALAVLFGSHARGEATAHSDIDLLVLPASGASFDSLGFEAEAQHIVGGACVDLILLHPALSSTLAWEALRDAAVLWEEARGTYEREVATWHARFQADAPHRGEQARHLTRLFGCP